MHSLYCEYTHTHSHNTHTHTHTQRVPTNKVIYRKSFSADICTYTLSHTLARSHTHRCFQAGTHTAESSLRV